MCTDAKKRSSKHFSTVLFGVSPQTWPQLVTWSPSWREKRLVSLLFVSQGTSKQVLFNFLFHQFVESWQQFRCDAKLEYWYIVKITVANLNTEPFIHFSMLFFFCRVYNDLVNFAPALSLENSVETRDTPTSDYFSGMICRIFLSLLTYYLYFIICHYFLFWWFKIRSPIKII